MVQIRRGRLRVVVADDHPSVRENLRYLINAEEDMECVAVARDGEHCLRVCRSLRPDVVVLDYDMPVMNGLAVAHVLENEFPEIHVVFYTLDSEIRRVAEAFGVDACVSKDAPYAVLVDAIRGWALPAVGPLA